MFGIVDILYTHHDKTCGSLMFSSSLVNMEQLRWLNDSDSLIQNTSRKELRLKMYYENPNVLPKKFHKGNNINTESVV